MIKSQRKHGDRLIDSILTGNVSGGCLVFTQYILLSNFNAASGLPIAMRYLGLFGNMVAVMRPTTDGIEQMSRYIRQES